jgi:hypothetical protein
MRFRVSKDDTATEYVIYDYLTMETVAVAKSLLEKPHFNIGRWYARKLKNDATRDKTLYLDAMMGPVVSVVATKLLVDGIQSYYPSRNPHLDPATRFMVRPPKLSREDFMIVDRDTGYMTTVSPTQLEDPSFDLIDWYMKYLSCRLLMNQLELSGIKDLVGSTGLLHECPQDHRFVSCEMLDSASQEKEMLDDAMYDDMPGLETLSEQNGSTDDDMPGLIALSNSDDLDEDGYHQEAVKMARSGMRIPHLMTTRCTRQGLGPQEKITLNQVLRR